MPQVIYMPENKNTVGAQMAQMLPMLQQLALAKIQKKWTAEERAQQLEEAKVALEEQRKYDEQQGEIDFKREKKLRQISASAGRRPEDPNKQRNTEIDRRCLPV